MERQPVDVMSPSTRTQGPWRSNAANLTAPEAGCVAMAVHARGEGDSESRFGCGHIEMSCSVVDVVFGKAGQCKVHRSYGLQKDNNVVF